MELMILFLALFCSLRLFPVKCWYYVKEKMDIIGLTLNSVAVVLLGRQQ